MFRNNTDHYLKLKCAHNSDILITNQHLNNSKFNYLKSID